MAVLIKDPETDRVVRELAARTGETLTEAVRKAAEHRLASLPPLKRQIDMDKVRALLAEIDALPRGEDISMDDAIGYDENGLPS
jgi:antitoxin VapB